MAIGDLLCAIRGFIALFSRRIYASYLEIILYLSEQSFSSCLIMKSGSSINYDSAFSILFLLLQGVTSKNRLLAESQISSLNLTALCLIGLQQNPLNCELESEERSFSCRLLAILVAVTILLLIRISYCFDSYILQVASCWLISVMRLSICWIISYLPLRSLLN